MNTDTATDPTDFLDMTISEVLALMPDGCEWTIIDADKASVKTEDGSTGSIWWDTQDPSNEGWAYEIRNDRGEETGELDDADDLAKVFS